MKTLNTIAIASILTFFMSWSCTDDFVDVESQDPNSEDFFNSEADYQDALVGAYDLLQSTYLNVMLGEIASSNTLAGGESATDVIGIQEIDNMVHTPVNQQLRDIWSWMYAGVNRASYILEYKDKTDFPGKSEVIAQARFLRAYYYFELIKWFGDVPFKADGRIQFGDQFELDRTPKSEIYAFLVNDLEAAANDLPATQEEAGRITKGAAHALQGKMYLYMEEWAKAAEALDKVIAGPYSMVDDYESIFEQEGENNEQSVFEVQYTDKEGAGFGCLQCSEGNVAVGFNGIRNYSGPFFDSGFSFNVPTQEAYELYEPGDIRRDVAILDIEAWAAQTGATYSEGHEHTGYYNRKYIARQGDLNTGDANLTNPNNYRAIRLADVYLMAAEAYYRSDEGMARDYLNVVREKAGLPKVEAASGPDLLDAIYRERRVELMGEGHHFFDLVRTDRAKDEIDGFVKGKHDVFPIPSIEIELAGNRWEQNPNY